MNLKALQKQFQTTILNANISATDYVCDGGALTAMQKIQIYRNSYYERIIAAMKADFPIMNAMLGDEAFSSLVCDYIDTYPSQDYSLRCIGKNLSQFILNKDNALLAYSDLARFEYLMCEVEWGKINLSDIRFESQFNIIEVWNAFQIEGSVMALALRAA